MQLCKRLNLMIRMLINSVLFFFKIKYKSENFFLKHWYCHKVSLFSVLLFPLSLVFRLIIFIRRYLYINAYLSSFHAPIPVIIVGNITLGGTGKTPLVIYIANLLKEAGFIPGIISRGYKGTVNHTEEVSISSIAARVGDEALLLAQLTGSPVFIAKKRSIAINALLAKYPTTNVIVTDDGLQHYALHRDIEIAVFAGEKKFGNGLCLPAGPLREPITRLNTVDYIVQNGGAKIFPNSFIMQMVPTKVLDMCSMLTSELSSFSATTVHAIAGIAHPQHFFDLLKNAGLIVIPHSFADHYFFTMDDISFQDEYPIFMTAKDAVKCKKLLAENKMQSFKRYYQVNITALLPTAFAEQLLQSLKEINHG